MNRTATPVAAALALAVAAWSAAALATTSAGRGDTPDALSVACVGCHDGDRASRVRARRAGMPGRYAGHRSTDHPVGMSYGAYAAADPRSYRPHAQLDPSVRLVDGKVTCVSCHRLEPGLDSTHTAPGAAPAGCLASGELAGERGGLCLACHLL